MPDDNPSPMLVVNMELGMLLIRKVMVACRLVSMVTMSLKLCVILGVVI